MENVSEADAVDGLLGKWRREISGAAKRVSAGRAGLADLGEAFRGATEEIDELIVSFGFDPDTYKSYAIDQFYDVFIEDISQWAKRRARNEVRASLARLGAAAIGKMLGLRSRASRMRAFVDTFHDERERVHESLGGMPAYADALRSWTEGAGWIYARVAPPIQRITVGGEVIVLIGDWGERDVLRWKRVLEHGYGMLAAKRLTAAWGPNIVVTTVDVMPRESDRELRELEKVGIELKKAGARGPVMAGYYTPATDQIVVRAGYANPMLETLFHELGHRYYTKGLGPTERARWVDMLRTRVRSYDEPGIPGDTTSEGEPSPIEPPTTYGASNAEEAFADTFALYVTNELERGDTFEFFRTTIGRPLGESVREAVRLCIEQIYRTTGDYEQ